MTTANFTIDGEAWTFAASPSMGNNVVGHGDTQYNVEKVESSDSITLPEGMEGTWSNMTGMTFQFEGNTVSATIDEVESEGTVTSVSDMGSGMWEIKCDIAGTAWTFYLVEGSGQLMGSAAGQSFMGAKIS